MIGSPLAAGVAKVAAVAILMAAGAGGIYIVSRTGDPGAGNPRFTFDPVPVVTSIHGTPVSFDPRDCSVFTADEVQVLTSDLESVDQIEKWAVDHGFTLLRETLGLSDALLLFQVPPGSVPDAEELFSRQPGVRAASRNQYLRYPESTEPPLVACTPNPR